MNRCSVWEHGIFDMEVGSTNNTIPNVCIEKKMISHHCSITSHHGAKD